MPTDPVEIEAMADAGMDLRRPECVLCTASGDMYVSDWEGGVTEIAANGKQRRILSKVSAIDLRPNGIALLQDGSFLLASLGNDGGVWHLRPDGSVQPFVTEVDGTVLPATNFVYPDPAGRVWISVSTRVEPRADAYRRDVADGFIVLRDARGTRIAVDGLGYANEVRLHPDGRHLYVNETFARRLSRMRVGADGSLGNRETVFEFGYGIFPDGLEFDQRGGIWIVSIVSNRVLRIDRNGKLSVIVDDSDPGHVENVETAFRRGAMGRPHLDRIASRRLRNVSSIAFGGPDRRICYLGCLLGDRLVSFESPVSGVEPVHWNWHAG